MSERRIGFRGGKVPEPLPDLGGMREAMLAAVRADERERLTEVARAIGACPVCIHARGGGEGRLILDLHCYCREREPLS